MGWVGGQPDSDSSRITYNRTLHFETIFQGRRATHLAPLRDPQSALGLATIVNQEQLTLLSTLKPLPF